MFFYHRVLSGTSKWLVCLFKMKNVPVNVYLSLKYVYDRCFRLFNILIRKWVAIFHMVRYKDLEDIWTEMDINKKEHTETKLLFQLRDEDCSYTAYRTVFTVRMLETAYSVLETICNSVQFVKQLKKIGHSERKLNLNLNRSKY